VLAEAGMAGQGWFESVLAAPLRLLALADGSQCQGSQACPHPGPLPPPAMERMYAAAAKVGAKRRQTSAASCVRRRRPEEEQASLGVAECFQLNTAG
jgi:hypothetical protein